MNEHASTFSALLFAAVGDSARLHEKLGRNEARWAIDRCLKRMERAVDALGGKAIKVAGEELMAVFPTADAAFQAAVEMRQRVDDLPPISGLRLEIRVGFAFGPAQVMAEDAIGEAVKEAAWLLGIARPGKILTNSTTLRALSSALQCSTRLFEAEGIGRQAGGKTVHEVAPSGVVQDAAPAVPLAPLPQPRLVLQHDDEQIILGEERKSLSLGRAECDLMVRGSRVSRIHAMIEWRHSRFVIIDMSTNGTFVKIGAAPETTLQHQELVLHGKGMIGLASSSRDPETDCIGFELLLP